MLHFNRIITHYQYSWGWSTESCKEQHTFRPEDSSYLFSLVKFVPVQNFGWRREPGCKNCMMAAQDEVRVEPLPNKWPVSKKC